LRSIKTYSSTEDNKANSPPIIFVGTHGDELEEHLLVGQGGGIFAKT